MKQKKTPAILLFLALILSCFSISPLSSKAIPKDVIEFTEDGIIIHFEEEDDPLDTLLNEEEFYATEEPDDGNSYEAYYDVDDRDTILI